MKTKLFTIVLYCAYMNNVRGDPIKTPSIKLSEEVHAQVIQAFDKCSTTLNYNKEQLPEVYIRTSAGEVIEDPEFKKLIHCVYLESGYIQEDGRLLLEKTAAIFPDKDTMVKFLTECDRQVVPSSDPVDVTFQYYKCFQLKSPLKVNLST